MSPPVFDGTACSTREEDATKAMASCTCNKEIGNRRWQLTIATGTGGAAHCG